MKKIAAILIMIQSALIFTGCEFIGDIFKAGVWVGIIIFVALAAVIGFLIKLFKK
ncbi:MAG TPA: phosphatidate cytidylyltransferase [Ignavibacteria bacterium]|nr:phosphatidate cytidylyltransferase [Ignavibacteria bacterium]HMR40257.1 phosphatidate cytidylyltransferase [Ignavibacteria bacterium]